MTGDATATRPPALARPPGRPAARRAADVRWEAIAAAVAALAALAIAIDAGVAGPGAVGDVARGALAAVALVWVTGYAPARLLAPRELRPHLVLLVPLFGAAACALALTVLGFLRVPFDAALALTLATGAASGAWLRLRRGPVPAARTGGESARVRVAWPLYVAALVALVALVPVFRSGFATVIGQNGDAVLAAGTAELLQEAPPGAVRPELAVDEVPLVWRSKYPIYYELAAVARLAGLEATDVLATFAAVMLALTGLAFLVLVRHALRAPPIAGLAAAALVPLDRIMVYVADHPYYNQLWATFSLPLILLFGLRYLERPGRAALAAFALFAALGTAAYPLMLPFPLLALGLAAWLVRRRRRAAGEPLGWVAALRLPRGRRSLALYLPAGLVALAVAPAIVLGIVEKAVTAGEVVVPWGDLYGWRGALGYLPAGRFVGLPDAAVWVALLAPPLAAAAALGLRRAPRAAAVPLGVTIALGLAFGAYFRIRPHGDLFYFKTLSFTGTLIVACAAAGIGWLAIEWRRRGGWRAAAGPAALTVLAAVFALGARAEIAETYDQLTPQMREVREWSRELPPGASVRIDVPPSGYQLWSWYMLAERPVSTMRPLVGTIFPYPSLSRKADYVLAPARGRPPRDADGPPAFANSQYRLFRMDPAVPGPDLSSRRLVQTVESISLD